LVLLLPTTNILAAWGETDINYDPGQQAISGHSMTDREWEQSHIDYNSCVYDPEFWPYIQCLAYQYVEVIVSVDLYSPSGIYVSGANAGPQTANFPLNAISPESGYWWVNAEHYVHWIVSEVVCVGATCCCIPPGCNTYDYYQYVTTTGDSVEVPVPCVDPGYTPPPLQSIPLPSHVSSIAGGTLLGEMIGIPDGSGFECMQRCVNGQNIWRLEGDFVLDPYTIEVVDELPSTSGAQGLQCPANLARPQQFISNSDNHENIHADVYRDEFSPYRNVLGTTYSTEQICETARASAVAGAMSHMANVASDQENNHPDHQGQQKTTLACLNPGSTVELWCGSGGGIPFFPGMCPGGNDY
jgi:hypothetical protein